MTLWVANIAKALRAQCGPFIPMLIISATVWLGDFKLSLIAIYILIGHHAYFQLKRFSSIFEVCVNMKFFSCVLHTIFCIRAHEIFFNNKLICRCVRLSVISLTCDR